MITGETTPLLILILPAVLSACQFTLHILPFQNPRTFKGIQATWSFLYPPLFKLASFFLFTWLSILGTPAGILSLYFEASKNVSMFQLFLLSATKVFRPI